MIGTCDFCGNGKRKIKELCDNGIPILAQCRYGCDNRRSIPSATNRIRPFEVLEIKHLDEGYMDSKWYVVIKDERDRVYKHTLLRRNGETVEKLLKEIKTKCKNAKQIIPQ